MSRVCFVCILVFALTLLPSCGHPTQLASISVAPTTATIIGLGGGGQVQFTAFGQFIHPTETRDITKLVTWTSTFPDVASIDSNGLATSGFVCGLTVITATAGHNIGVPFDSQAITVANASFIVTVPNVPGCPPAP